MNEETKTYQLTCLFKPNLKQEELEKVTQEIKDWMEKKQGVIEEQTGLSGAPVKQSLNYPIKKEEEAFFWQFEFSLLPGLTDEFRQYLDSNKNIIRHLIDIKKQVKTKPAKQISDRTFDLNIVDKIEPLTPKKEIKPEPKKELDEKELDKKLEEILNQ